MTLALRGLATKTKCGNRGSNVFRLRQPSLPPADFERDAALIRTAADVASAQAQRFANAVFLSGDDAEEAAENSSFATSFLLPKDFAYLHYGDVVALTLPSGRFRTLFRQASSHNAFLVTERCDHYCLMCSQPPKNVDDRWILKEISEALSLVDPATRTIGFTGGEPLLAWKEFIALLVQCRDALPSTAVHVLSNGRAFRNPDVVSAWESVGHPNLTVGIPIYSSVDHIHDYVVQAKGAFDETVLGILRLKDKKQKVEVRVVLHSKTAPQLARTCAWIARNLPFVDHVALMGLENTGFAIANQDELWIDPLDYADQLAEATNVLDSAGLHVSIYNLPRCILPRALWPFAVQSISDWKNNYLASCEGCVEMTNCSGFFSTGRPRYSRGVQAIF